MIDLTVIILTKNEEKNLRKCIRSFYNIAKRFVIVDSFSTDKTEELCNQVSAELNSNGCQLDFYQHEWSSYAEQFNWALHNTYITTEWVMRMDADEELTPELAKEIDIQLSNSKENINGFILKRRVYFLGKWIKHGGKYPELLLRIFRNGHAECEQKLMDEHIVLFDGKMKTLSSDLIDNNQKNLEWWTAKHNWYSNREVLDHYMTQNNELDNQMEVYISSKQAKIKRKIKNSGYYRLPKFFRAHLYFIYRYYFRFGFLDGTEGKIYHFFTSILVSFSCGC